MVVMMMICAQQRRNDKTSGRLIMTEKKSPSET